MPEQIKEVVSEFGPLVLIACLLMMVLCDIVVLIGSKPTTTQAFSITGYLVFKVAVVLALLCTSTTLMKG